MTDNETLSKLRSMAARAPDESDEEKALIWAVDRIEALENFRVAIEMLHDQTGTKLTRLRAKIGEPA